MAIALLEVRSLRINTDFYRETFKYSEGFSYAAAGSYRRGEEAPIEIHASPIGPFIGRHYRLPISCDPYAPTYAIRLQISRFAERFSRARDSWRTERYDFFRWRPTLVFHCRRISRHDSDADHI